MWQYMMPGMAVTTLDLFTMNAVLVSENEIQILTGNIFIYEFPFTVT